MEWTKTLGGARSVIIVLRYLGTYDNNNNFGDRGIEYHVAYAQFTLFE